MNEKSGDGGSGLPPLPGSRQTRAGGSVSARLMDLANQTTPTVADFDTVRAAMEAERGRGGAVPAAFRGLAKQDALDKEVGLNAGATKADRLSEMEAGILDSGQLMGTYRRR